jgi:hypothetical protein
MSLAIDLFILSFNAMDAMTFLYLPHVGQAEGGLPE